MGKGIFEKIADFISGSSEEPSCGSNGIDTIDNIQRDIVSKLSRTYRGRQDVTFNKDILVVWIVDQLTFNLINTKEFKTQLIEKMDEELGYKFASVEIEVEPSKQKEAYSKVVDNIHLLIRAKQEQVMSAKITIYEGYGSMLDECCTLNSNSERQYNIGVGREPKLSSGGYRENHIAIDDDENSPQYENNKYVSRAHAHISYCESAGFMLYAEVGGIRQTGKRTRIYRNAQSIEINNPMLPVVLCDGDIIELSKTVKLLFQRVTN
ncbi:MAG: hypothetical protein SNH13_04485 [Rikenellaceae bacterium]